MTTKPRKSKSEQPTSLVDEIGHADPEIRVPNSLIQQIPSVGVDAVVVYMAATYLQAAHLSPSRERLAPLTGLTPEAVDAALTTLKDHGFASEARA